MRRKREKASKRKAAMVATWGRNRASRVKAREGGEKAGQMERRK